MNTYDTIKAMSPGTVFHMGGAPWLRGDNDDIMDLIPVCAKRGFTPIPRHWTESYDITILYKEEY